MSWSFLLWTQLRLGCSPLIQAQAQEVPPHVALQPRTGFALVPPTPEPAPTRLPSRSAAPRLAPRALAPHAPGAENVPLFAAFSLFGLELVELFGRWINILHKFEKILASAR